MRILTALLTTLALAAASPAFAQETGPAQRETFPIDGVVAVVGEQPILRSQVEEEIGQMQSEGYPLPSDSAGQAELVRQVIARLVDAELLVQQARAANIQVSDNEIAADIDRRVSSIRGRFSSDAEFRSQLRSAGFGTPEEYRRWMLEQARRAKLQEKIFDKLRAEGKITPVPVSEAEVDSMFQASKSQIQRLPATVTYRQIVVTPKPSAKEDSAALAKAESLLAEIRKGGDFAEIAKRESMDPGSKEQGGDLGWHRRGQFVPPFERMYFALPPGQVSPVVKTVFGYHIIKVDRVQPAEVKGRHILIVPEIDSADVATAHRLADSVATMWRSGVSYDTLVAKYHDQAEEKLMPHPYPQASLPHEYQEAIKGHKNGDILDPFPIEDRSRGVPKFFILQITSIEDAREPTLADYRQTIREQLSQQKAIHRYMATLRKQTYVSIRH
jgi:peptidyl-prolyl cis-trans isomerase SurA